MTCTIHHFPSHALTQSDESELAALLDRCFPDTFEGRSYFKQLPHARFLARDDGGRLLGQLGIDHRVIRVGEQAVPILGLIDLCVDAPARRRGVGSRLLHEAERHARQASARIDFLLLVTDLPAFYQAKGYRHVGPVRMRWLAVEDRRSHSVMEHVENELFAKSLCGRPWPDGSIDLLGCLF